MKFELNNLQREYIGLEPILPNWEPVPLDGGPYRGDGIAYFEGDVLKRYIVSYDNVYKEAQFNEQTKNRKILLPKTSKGKEKKLTASVLESRHPTGVYIFVDDEANLLIGNHTTQTTFYSNTWDKTTLGEGINVSEIIARFISESSATHLSEIREFKDAQRKHCKFKSGDFFVYKVSRTEYGFGRVLLDVAQLRKKKLIPGDHGLSYLMGPPVLTMLYGYISKSKQVDINDLLKAPTLPADFMMDNGFLYGEFEIIGHLPVKEDEFEFPMSYGRRLDQRPEVFLQWGIIHLDRPQNIFSKHLTTEFNGHSWSNPYGFYSIGFRPRHNVIDIRNTVQKGQFDFSQSTHYWSQYDLRNPINKKIRAELMKTFGLNPEVSYEENRKLTNTISAVELVNKL